VARRGLVLKKAPEVPAAIVSGPVRNAAYCSPLRILRTGLLTISLSVIGFRRVEHDLDAVLAQQFRRSHAGELQKLRRVEGASRNHDLLAGRRHFQDARLPVFNRQGTTSFEPDALRGRRGLDAQIAAALRRAKIGDRRARPPAATRRGLEESRALLRDAVEIAIDGQAGLGRSLDEGRRKRIGMSEVGNRQRPADAVKIIRAAPLIFGFLEIRQDVVEAPALIALLAPAIVILVLATDIKQAVDRTRSAEHLAARLEYSPAVQLRLRLGLVHPVDALLLEQLAIAERNVNPEIGVPWTRFEQQHRVFSVGAQAIGEHAPGRARANHDVVVFGSFGTCRGLRAHVVSSLSLRRIAAAMLLRMRIATSSPVAGKCLPI
jgi:hypothetical protein